MICARHDAIAVHDVDDPHVHVEYGMAFCWDCFLEAREYAEATHVRIRTLRTNNPTFTINSVDALTRRMAGR